MIVILLFHVLSRACTTFLRSAQEDIDEKMLAQKSSTGPTKFNWSQKDQLAQKKFIWSKTYLEYLLAFMAHELVFFAVSPQMNIERV